MLLLFFFLVVIVSFFVFTVLLRHYACLHHLHKKNYYLLDEMPKQRTLWLAIHALDERRVRETNYRRARLILFVSFSFLFLSLLFIISIAVFLCILRNSDVLLVLSHITSPLPFFLSSPSLVLSPLLARSLSFFLLHVDAQTSTTSNFVFRWRVVCVFLSILHVYCKYVNVRIESMMSTFCPAISSHVVQLNSNDWTVYV